MIYGLRFWLLTPGLSLDTAIIDIPLCMYEASTVEVEPIFQKHIKKIVKHFYNLSSQFDTSI